MRHIKQKMEKNNQEWIKIENATQSEIGGKIIIIIKVENRSYMKNGDMVRIFIHPIVYIHIFPLFLCIF